MRQIIDIDISISPDDTRFTERYQWTRVVLATASGSPSAAAEADSAID
jgi:hypothetical protein